MTARSPAKPSRTPRSPVRASGRRVERLMESRSAQVGSRRNDHRPRRKSVNRWTASRASIRRHQHGDRTTALGDLLAQGNLARSRPMDFPQATRLEFGRADGFASSCDGWLHGVMAGSPVSGVTQMPARSTIPAASPYAPAAPSSSVTPFPAAHPVPACSPAAPPPRRNTACRSFTLQFAQACVPCNSAYGSHRGGAGSSRSPPGRIEMDRLPAAP